MDPLDRDVMLDPSLLLAWVTYRDTLHKVTETPYGSSDLRFFVPESLLHGMRQERDSIPWLYWFFASGQMPTAPERLLVDVESSAEAIRPYKVSGEDAGNHGPFRDRLRASLESTGIYSETLVRVLWEEWVFLQEHSWLSARVSPAFDHMVEAGATCLRLGTRAFDRAVRKTLRYDDDHGFRRYDRIRALGKWVAAGGAPFVALASEVAGVVVSAGAGAFLLVDPPDAARR